jgi:hypothetical protein
VRRENQFEQPLRAGAAVVVALLIAASAWGQSGSDASAILPSVNGVPFSGETRAGADIGLQGYYLGGSQQLSTTTGAFVRYHDFIPNVGLLGISLESYGSDGRFRFGDNFVTLAGVVWRGRRWNFTAGDFRLAANPIEIPFSNLINPEIAARGVKVDASSKGRTISMFFGEVTLLEGPRVPFRIGSGQYLMGATMRQKIGSRLTIGARLLRVSTSDAALMDNAALLPSNRQYLNASNAAVQSSFEWTKHLKLFGEAGLAGGSLAPSAFANSGGTATPATITGSAPLTLLAGAIYDTPKFTARLNYTSQGAAYLPVAGQFAGDRRGPFAELRYHPFKALEVFGSVSRYRNNLEDNQESTTYHSSGYSAGASVLLPLKISASAQLSELSYYSLTPDTSSPAPTSPIAMLREDSNNRQVSASLARSFGRQNLHFTWRDLLLEEDGPAQHQRSQELEDQVNFGRLSFGVAIRMQNAVATDHRNTVFGRGSMQANFRRFQAYAQVEIGQDLVNQTVFSTSSYNTTVVGLSVPARGGWVLHAEMFQVRQNLLLNPESIFLFGDTSTGLPTTLPGFNQRSLYLRITKSFQWGDRLPSGSNIDQYTRQQIPVTGSVEGFVSETSASGSHRVDGISVILDNDRVVKTDSEGRFVIPAVPEGPHHVGLAVTELPAEFNPGAISESGVMVAAQKISRVDLQVIRLGEILGHVDAPPKSGDDNDVESIVIRMEPGGRYTTPDADGNFGFYNLPEGEYQIKLDSTSLPVHGAMTTAAEFPVTVKGGQPLPEIRFGYVIKIPEKPVHRTLEQTIMIDAKGETVPVNTPAPAPAVAPNAVAAPTRAAPAAPATPSGPAGPGPDAPANPNS